LLERKKERERERKKKREKEEQNGEVALAEPIDRLTLVDLIASRRGLHRNESAYQCGGISRAIQLRSLA